MCLCKEKRDAMARLNIRGGHLKAPAYQRKLLTTDDPFPPADIEQLLWHTHLEGLSEDEYEDEKDG